jgi:MraZ protein
VNAFRGQFEHQMDGKGRVSLPSAFRRDEVDRFVLIQVQAPYLTLFPEPKWAEVEERFMEFGASGRTEMNAIRALLSGLVEVSPDKQGRILIPAHLQEKAGLDGSVILLGMRDRVELWDPETYEREVEGSSTDLDAIALRLIR